MGDVPDYAAEIEYSGEGFSASEFRMLRRQLVPFLQDSEGVCGVRHDRSHRSVTAVLVVNAPSSSTAMARASSTARALLPRLRAVRTGVISLRVRLVRDERAEAASPGGSRTLVDG
ncbi:hypothetical protein GCM10027568_21490 [Humibacter soli]